MNLNYKKIGDFIKSKVPGMEFIGITDEGEVFVYLDKDPENYKSIALLRNKFPKEISKVSVVETISLREAEHLLQQVEKALEEQERKVKMDNLQLLSPIDFTKERKKKNAP